MSINRVTLLGRTGKDPEKRYTTQGTAVATFSLATTENVTKDRNNPTLKTTWHEIKCWGKLADMADEKIRKGDEVWVEGRITTESWDDKQTGKKVYRTMIVAAVVRVTAMAGYGKGNGESQQSDDSSMNESPW